MNLTYLNVTLTGKMLRWKLYLQDKDFDSFTYTMFLETRYTSRFPMLILDYARTKQTTAVGTLSSLQLEADLSLHSSVETEQLL